MSGGRFNYSQHHIQNIIDDVEDVIEKNGKKIEYEVGYRRDEWEPEYHYEYPPEVIEEFKKGLHILKQAYVYAHSIDLLLSGDNSEESFLQRLEKDMKKIS